MSSKNPKKKLNLPLLEVFVASLLLHIVAGVILGGFVLYSAMQDKEPEFVPPPEIKRIKPEQLEYKVKMKKQQKNSAKPRMPRIQVASPTKIQVPEIDIVAPAISSQVAVGTGTGTGSGRGDGLGSGGGMGLGKIDVKPFFNIRGELDRSVFCIDISGSMVQQGRDLRTFDRVYDELEMVLQGMTASTARFNVIVFAGRGYTYKSEWTVASPANNKKVLKWLRSYSPSEMVRQHNMAMSNDRYDWKNFMGARHQGTNAYQALEMALGMKPRTVFILSDGSPTTGGRVDPKAPELRVEGIDSKGMAVLQMVDRVQSTLKQKAIIHGIAYHSDAPAQAFMKALARLNKGKFRKEG